MSKSLLLQYLLAFLISSWALGYGLDAMPMFIWDESRQANNAIEMVLSGNYGYPTYDGQPDFWNTKPHLLIVLQALSMKILGPGLLALRLPSLLAGIGVCMLWFRFFAQRNQFHSARIFLIVLLSCGGFNTYHVVRTGDYDSLLLLFISASLIAFYSLIFENGGKKAAITAGSMISLAVLTKSIAGFLWLPVIGFAAVLVHRQSIFIIKKQAFYLLLPLLSIPVYYFTREVVAPGYLKAVWINEFADRYLKPNEGHHTGVDYYFHILQQESLGYYFYPSLFFLLMGFWVRNAEKYYKWLATIALLFFVVIHASATRISWYAAPGVVLLSLMIGIGLTQLIQYVQSKNKQWMMPVAVVIYAIIGVTAYTEWQLQRERNFTLEGVKPEKVLRDAEKSGKFRYGGKWLCGHYKPYELYYSKVFLSKNIPFRSVELNAVNAGDTVHFYDYSFSDSLNKKFHVTQIHAPDSNYPVWVFSLKEKVLPQRN